MTLGYDPQKKQYAGTWVGSMMTYLWVYDGLLDAEEKVLTHQLTITFDEDDCPFVPDGHVVVV